MNISKEDLLDGLFGTPKDIFNVDKISTISLDLIDDLHCFEHAYEKSLQMGFGIEELAEQIKAIGQQQPIVIRRKVDNEGRYELLIGHRRKRACLLAGQKTIKAIIVECSNDEAQLISIDNLGQRPYTFLSEIAKAYKIQIEALKKQGKRTDLIKKVEEESNFGQKLPEVDDETKEENNFGQKLPEVNARDIIAQKYNISPRKVSNFLRLNELVPNLLDMVDNKQIPFMAGVHLSYLKEKEQFTLAELLNMNKEFKVTVENAKELRAAAEHMLLNEMIIEATINPPKEDSLKDFIKKPQKPVYKVAIKGVEKYIKKLDTDEAEKLALADAQILEDVIKKAISSYLKTL